MFYSGSKWPTLVSLWTHSAHSRHHQATQQLSSRHSFAHQKRDHSLTYLARSYHRNHGSFISHCNYSLLSSNSLFKFLIQLVTHISVLVYIYLYNVYYREYVRNIITHILCIVYIYISCNYLSCNLQSLILVNYNYVS